ncbi:hypothetical protein C5D44_12810 [Rathayibacter sp. AY1B5]|nr:hypothetical protein C5D44_12810 [Rathayibacter sp. AY1B5]
MRMRRSARSLVSALATLTEWSASLRGTGEPTLASIATLRGATAALFFGLVEPRDVMALAAG